MIRPTTTSTTPATPSTPAPPEAPGPSINELIGKAMDGSITPGEATKLAELLDSPGLKDAFSPQQRKELQKFVEGKGLPPRDPGELHSDFKLVKDAKELPARFAADLVLAHEALLEHAGLLRSDKASRLFAFAVPYAQQLAEMAQSPSDLNKLANALLAQADKAGFRALERQPDGADGVRALKELLKTGSAEEMGRLANGLKFDAPTWPKDPAASEREHLQAIKAAGDANVMRPLPQVMQPPVPIQRKVDEQEERPGHDGTTDKKLGGSMLWNALHRLRDSGENEGESAAQRDALNQLMWAAGLILVGFAVIVGVLVAL